MKTSFTSSQKFTDAMLMLVAICWGSGFPITNMAILAGITPNLLVALRFLIPAVLMAILFRQELVCISKEDVMFGMIAGLILFLAFLTQTYGILYTTPSNNAFLTCSNVILVPFTSWAFFKQRPSLHTVSLAFLCFVGIATLSYSPGLGISFNLGDWLSLACAGLYACHISFLGMYARKIRSAAVLNFFQMAVTGVLGLFAFLLLELPTFELKSLSGGLWPCIYLGIFPTGICFFLQGWAQRRSSSTVKTAVLLSTEGLFGSILSVMMGYDSVTVGLLVGGSIIVLSVVLMQVDFARIIDKLKARRYTS